MGSVSEFPEMDNYQGDLTDVVRGIGSGHVSASPGPPEDRSPPPATNLHVDFPSFGDPFVRTADPLHLTANSGVTKKKNTFAIFPRAFEEDHVKSQCTVFPQIRISQSSIIHDTAAVSAAAASPWRMINVDNHNIASSSSQIQISSSPRNLGIKRRKSQAKKVVCIPAPAAMNSRSSGEVVPSDLWAWRKYGQKPIKGSPYPRGYYKCSSSKGCSARKQVERSRTDPNILVITYNSEHNHPWPTQRNALAGSTRSSSSSSNPCSKSAAVTTSISASSRVSQNINYNKDEPNKSHLTSSSIPPFPAMEESQDSVEFDNDIREPYRPEFQHQPEDFFAELYEFEGDPLTLLLSQGFAGESSGGGNLENKTTLPDVFSDFFDDDHSSRSL